MTQLTLKATIPLPPGEPGRFDHADVDRPSGRVFVAHTGFDTVEAIDAETLTPAGRIEGCPEGSGVLCARISLARAIGSRSQERPDKRIVFAAARGAGKVLMIDPDRLQIEHEIGVGSKPNGLAWDPTRQHLLVADIDDYTARLVDIAGREIVATTQLPGRPRWCVYDASRDRFLVNIVEPAAAVVLAGATANISAQWPVGSAGPHGLDLDPEKGRAFVACDGGHVIAIDLDSGQEVGRTSISGVPDAIWFNAQAQRLYVAIGKPGVIDVIDTTNMSLAQTVVTEAGAQTTAYDADRQRLYAFLPESCAANVYEDR